MPHTKSAKKRARTSKESRAGNMAATSLMKTRQRQLFEALTRKDREAGARAFSIYCSTLDKAAKHGVITRNTAIRKKQRAAARLQTIKS